MYARIERFNLPQNLAETAEDLADRIEPILRDQPGFHSLTLLSDETSGEYLFLTLWETLEDIGRYDRSNDEWRVRDIISPYLTAVPQIEVYQAHNLPTATGATPVAGEPTLS
jgi:heme-degrading monooxygenase HmoA